ncbi:hypothetical protein [Pararhodospirillum oryzae]|uniref:Methylaspartate ammonia-lyase n=1 Tax=Pararhodospirillum oryzae TaxID=478448 RepID=A0A512HBQ6_9PROT|nr:hypothetical protein [Pararhodospirillum oryzae]GEO82883.1 hypothetical protein ROR02_30140 [Pararhodospirillum oryzae]
MIAWKSCPWKTARTGIVVLGAVVLASLPARAAPPAASSSLLARSCQTLAQRVGEPWGPAVFLRSHDAATGDGPPANPALATAAFSYDNALAVLALLACDEPGRARRIGEALRRAALHDRTGEAGRLRSAYRAGPQPDAPSPNGWWDPAQGRWLEDDAQVSTSTGNVAWAGLALVALAETDKDPALWEAAAALGAWIWTHAHDPRGPGGFTGGLFGTDATPVALTWKSTEHAADAAALFERLAAGPVPGPWAEGRAAARAFLNAQWVEAEGRFRIGTQPDGVTPNDATSGLDAQVWPPLLTGAPAQWRRALAYAHVAHGVEGGFSFNRDKAGIWTEGTAQAALTARAVGEDALADQALATLAGLASPGGYLWATPEARLPTGLALGPDRSQADFFYEHQPHLGATAWAVLAARGWNPFTGRVLPSRE